MNPSEAEPRITEQRQPVMVGKNKKSRPYLFLLPGGCLGWILGLSASPVTQLVLGSVLTIVCATAGVAAGITEIKGKSLHFDPVPVVCLLLGIAMVAPLGIFARSNAVFGVNPAFLSWRWATSVSNRAKIQEELFKMLVSGETPSEPSSSHATNIARNFNMFSDGALHNLSVDQIQRLKTLQGEPLRRELREILAPEMSVFVTNATEAQLIIFRDTVFNR
jgi:hypothetical protein